MKAPRPHQTEAIKAVVNGFKSHKLGKLIMACGTGKTLIAGWVRQEIKADCTLFMAPSNALLAQTLQAWREISSESFEALAVCCDRTVAKGRDEDDLPAAEVGTAVTTDYQDIARFISSTGRRVVLCTYQSSEALASAMSLVSVPQFDLAVADEAHRTTGGGDHVFPSITNPEKIRAAKKLFMTATPRLYFNNGEDDIVSMDNEELYGPVFHEFDFAEAIERGLLTEYEVLVVGVSQEAEKEAEDIIKRNPQLKVGDRKLAARDLAVNIAILRTIQEKGLQRVITFHSSCARAQAAADFLPQLQAWMPMKYRTMPGIWARTVNHTMSTGSRQEILQDFEDLKGPGLLTNSHCLGEGVDVPAVDAIVFMDAKKSKIEIAQSVGRAIRLSPGKHKSYVILPVIMLPGDNPEQIKNNSFKTAFDVLNALRAHDSTLMEQLQAWKDKGDRGVVGGAGGVEGDEGRKISFAVPPDCDPRISGWFITKAAARWNTWGDTYAQVSKATKLTKRHYRWLYKGAEELRDGVLDSHKAYCVGQLLQKHDIPTPAKHGVAAAEYIEYGVKFAEEHGHLPPRSRVDRRGAKLANLMSRTLGSVPKMWTERMKRDIAWLRGVPTAREHARLRLVAEVDAYVAAHGARPPVTSSLGYWLAKTIRERKNYRDSDFREWLDRLMALTLSPTARAMQRRRASAHARHTQLLKELTDFCASNGRLPREGGTPPERKLFNFAQNVQDTLSPDIWGQLKALRSKYRYKKMNRGMRNT